MKGSQGLVQSTLLSGSQEGGVDARLRGAGPDRLWPGCCAAMVSGGGSRGEALVTVGLSLWE